MTQNQWSFTSFTIGEYAEPGALRDKLVAAILAGEKTATSSLYAQYLDAGAESAGELVEPLPAPGEGEIVVDSAGRPVAVTRTTRVDLVPMGQITDEFAQAEGEGFATVAEWRAAHLEFWNEIGLHPTDEDLVVCQRFELVADLR